MRDVPPPAKTPPPLVWPNGQLLRPANLAREVAAPRMASVRSILSGHPAIGLDPRRLARLLLSAEQGDAIAYLELAEEMEEKDPHYLSVLGTRKRAIAQMPIEVEAASDAAEHQQDAELIRKWLRRDMLQSELFDILDAVGKGYSATEIIWRQSSKSWMPQDLKWRDPRFFEFDRVNGETLYLRGAGEPEALEAGKFIIHFHKAKSGLPIRGGMARVVAWGWMFKNYAIKDWVSFLETYGMPLRLGRYDNGETEANVAILARAVADLGSDAAAVFPKTMDVEFVDGKGGTAPSDLWRSMAEYIDSQVSKALLGQTNTTDAQAGGLGSGQADVHNEVRKDIADADAMLLAATLNRDLVIPMVIFNHGQRDEYPRLKIGRPDAVDVAALTKAATALVPLGVKVGARQLREAAGLPEPEEGEEVLSAPSAPGDFQNGANLPPQGASGAAKPLTPHPDPAPAFLDPLKSRLRAIASAQAGAAGDVIDDGADEAIGDWSEILEPLLDPLDALLASATSWSDVQQGLVRLIGAMDEGELMRRLAQASFAARLAGSAEQEQLERGAS